MNRMLVCVFTLVLLLGVVVTPLAAQENLNNEMARLGCVSVQGGDSLWRISEKVQQDPTLWEKLFDLNPFLQQDGRRYVNPANGWTYVLIRPGEFLCGLDKLGIVPTLASTSDLSAMGFAPPKPATVTVEKISPWSWLIPLGILLLVALALYALYLFFRRDPTRVGAGRVREEGLPTPTAAAEHFRTQLTQEFGQQGQYLPIVSLVRGRGYGWARVIDRMGSFFRRFLNGQPIWQATVRLPDGTQQIRYSLLGCANDVRGGGGMIPGWGFRFVAEENVTDQVTPAPAPAPQPEPQPAPAPQPEPQPAPAPQRSPEDEDEVVQLVPADEEGDELIRLTNIDAEKFTFRRGRNAAGSPVITFRFRRAKAEEEGPANS